MRRLIGGRSPSGSQSSAPSKMGGRLALPGVVRGAEVGVRHADGLRLRLGLDGLGERHPVLALQHLLRHGVGEGGAAGEALGPAHRFGHHLRVGDDAVGEADAVRLRRVDDVAEEEQLGRAAVADDPRQEEGGAHVGAGEADLREDVAEARALRGDAHVARGGDDGACPHGDAVDGRDDRAATLADRLDEGARHARELEQAARALLEEVGDDPVDVAAGAEPAALAGDDHDARVDDRCPATGRSAASSP